MSATMSWTIRLKRGCSAMKPARLQPSAGWFMLKWMLPSPTWPKATTRMPGSAGLAGRRCDAHEVGDPADRHRDIVLDRGALELLGLADRFAQPPQCAVLAAALRNHRVAHVAVRHRRGQPPPPARRATNRRRAAGQFDQLVAGMDLPERVADAGDMVERHLQRLPGHDLVARDAAAVSRCRADSRRSAASCPGIAATAVTVSRGFGNSFSTAPVMTPSVPSAPMNHCFRS